MCLPTISILLRIPLFCYYLINFSLTFLSVYVYTSLLYLRNNNHSQTYCLYTYLACSIVTTNLFCVYNNHNNYSPTTHIHLLLHTQKHNNIHSTLKYTTKKRFQTRYKTEENLNAFILTSSQLDGTFFLSIHLFNG